GARWACGSPRAGGRARARPRPPRRGRRRSGGRRPAGPSTRRPCRRAGSGSRCRRDRRSACAAWLDLARGSTRGTLMPERILPVLVGAGQTIDRPADPAAGREPLVLIEEAARRAAEDAGGGARLLAAHDTVAVVNVICHDYGDGRPAVSAHEARHGIGQPIVTYPMVENAFRAARRLSLEALRRELAAFAARAAAIAAENPYAWFRDAKDAATLATVTAENRM